MEIVSNAPVRTSQLLWQPAAGAYVLSLICKATFRLVPGVMEFDAEQENPNEEDNYWDDDPTRSLYAPTDLVPYKSRADVLLVGYAFASRGEVVRSLATRLLIGTVDKSIEVFADRSWANDGSLREGPRFARMPLRYERAAGGPDTPNPVGMRREATDAYGATAIPNLQPPGIHLSQRGDWMNAIGYGPIAPTWPGRINKLGPNAAPMANRLRYDAPLPTGLDPRFFNAAPEDQQTATIRPNERIVLEHLHADHPRLVTNLPGFTLRAVYQRNGVPDKELSLDCDTLWIDTNSSRCTVVWRGRMALSHPAETGRITVTMEEPEAAARRAQIAAPSTISDEEDDEIFSTQVGGSSLVAALPFLPTQVPARPQAPAPATHNPIPFAPASSRPAMPFHVQAPPVPPQVPVAPPVPPVVAPAPPVVPGAPPSSPWALGAPIDKVAIDLAPPPPVRPPAPSIPPVGFSGQRYEATIPVTSKPPVIPLSDATKRGIASASTAAAAASISAERAEKPLEPIAPVVTRPNPQPAATPAREAMMLLWFDEARADDITARPQWVKILSESDIPEEPEPKKDEDDESEDEDYFAEEQEEEEEEPESVKKRKRVAKILARGEPADGPGLALAVSDAVTKHGTLDPPIMLVAGELSFPFDPWETLKTLIIAATPAAVADKKLKEMLDAVQETAKMPGIERSTSIADALATRVREAFTQSNRNLGSNWLDAQAEKMLVEGRCHQKRSVLGQTFLRCLLHAPGADEGIPTYVPEALSKTIPLVARMRTRIIAEVHPQQDQYETYPRALRVLALARMVELGTVRMR